MPYPGLLSRALAAVDPSVTSLKEFQLISGIGSRSVAGGIIAFFADRGIGGGLSSGVISFSAADRMKAALECIRNGCDIRDVSVQLSWGDFEQLASEILKAFGYRTRTNVRFVRPRMEIDVVGTRSSLAIVVDCKHWKHNNRSLISGYSIKQAARASRLVEQQQDNLSRAVPLILTLHAESVKFVGKIPIVPVAQFSSFVEDVEAYLPEICVIRRS